MTEPHDDLAPSHEYTVTLTYLTTYTSTIDAISPERAVSLLIEALQHSDHKPQFIDDYYVIRNPQEGGHTDLKIYGPEEHSVHAIRTSS